LSKYILLFLFFSFFSSASFVFVYTSASIELLTVVLVSPGSHRVTEVSDYRQKCLVRESEAEREREEGGEKIRRRRRRRKITELY